MTEYPIKYVELLATGRDIGLDGTLEDVVQFVRSKGAEKEFEEFYDYSREVGPAVLHLSYVDRKMIAKFSALYEKITGERFDPMSAIRDVCTLPMTVDIKVEE